jgi:hypothetical protein
LLVTALKKSAGIYSVIKVIIIPRETNPACKNQMPNPRYCLTRRLSKFSGCFITSPSLVSAQITQKNAPKLAMPVSLIENFAAPFK